ncbi:AraC family transcriptional regulator [Romboutsia sp. 1001216sp1]|nr:MULTISPECIES: AraC family transcriptional regulator [Romboutsia]MDB8792534.1 AraC family transcriptional regulator [Romboutsia sp. 1001216sp1]MDB8795829.1 AraC family transcriptional regulator [Romboutsia sp. 1001216sp1]MDB8798292.1 AraC family transcriptional regulator [Romboutsia sp. 1001216sp1]MDB8800992.1 AraC family transcriptional regulator [Romboutsia sp. 1001216sp1]MDB8803725.1 AraC family transcriptional regulator [Romboutsia sp. 1001216sp1]
MFIKTTNPAFKNFGELVCENLDRDFSKDINIKNKSIKKLKLTSDNSTFLKVNKGVVMILVSLDGKDIKSFIINRIINLKKGIYFNLISISDESEISIISKDEFKSINLKEEYTYTKISSSLNIDQIYTKFYQEKGTNYSFAGESHPYWELTYVDKGNLSTNVDGKEYNLKQGDLIFYAPFQFHTQATSDNISSYLTINFKMDSNDYEVLCNKVFTLERESYNIISKLIEELSNDDIYSNDLSICYLKQLIIHTARLKNTYFQSKPTTHMRQTYENSLLNEILSFIDEHIYEKLSINTLCSHFCISPSMIHSLFKKNMDNTVKNYINELKLSKSKELIKNTSYTISEISEMLGFSSIHYFSKKFKTSFGISPTEYSKSIYD